MTVTTPSQRDSRCDFGVSHTTPTRPDPTRPQITTRVETFHHGVAYVTREASTAMMTATRQGVSS